MQEVMCQDTPIEERRELLKNSCDQIVQKSYTRKFSSSELTERRTEYCDVAEKVNSLKQELSEVTADIKGKIKPLVERMGGILDDIKKRGEYITGECYKFIDPEEKKVGFYDGEGYLIEERDMTKEERQRTLFQAIRLNGTEG